MNTEQADTLGATARIVALGEQLSQLGGQLALQRQRIAELERERDALKALLREMYNNWRDDADGTYRIDEHIERISAAIDAAKDQT